MIDFEERVELRPYLIDFVNSHDHIERGDLRWLVDYFCGSFIHEITCRYTH